MITAYSASPVEIDKLDFEKIGSGAGVMRYAAGMYAGELETAKHYLESYKGYGLASRSFRMGANDEIHIEPDSLAYEITAALVDSDYDYEGVREKYKGDDTAIAAVDYLEKVGGVTVDYGVMHKIKIPHENMENIPSWNDELTPEKLDDIAMAFYKTQPDIALRAKDVLNELDSNLIFEDLEGALDDIWEMAYNEGVEEDTIPFHIGEEELKEIWNAKLRNDNYSIFDLESEFNEGINPKYLEAIDKIFDHVLCIENEMTIGDAYSAVASAYEPDTQDPEKILTGKKMASNLFSGEEIDIQMVTAPTIFGCKDAHELIIMSEKLANSILIEPISPLDFIHQNKDECSLTRLRFSGRDYHDNHDEDMSHDYTPNW